MPKADRQARAREEMQALIKRAAMKLFLEEGVERTSMRRIADAIGYTPGALYSYFKDKDEILFALHEDGFDKLFAMQGTIAPDDDPFDQLRALGRVYVRFAREHAEYYDLMFIMHVTGRRIRERMEEHEQDWQHGLRTYEFLKDVVARCQAAGRLPAHDLEGATFAIWSTVHGMVSLVIRDRCVMYPEEHIDQLLQSALDFVMKGMARGGQ